MSEEILINVTPMETRVAVIENGVVQELYIERHRARGLVGNIYKGRVVRVLPGMQAAFVDIGLERASFIHASDILLPNGQSPAPDADIRTLLREGQSLVVQVLKDPIGTKGARLTTQLSVSSRFLVYMPREQHIGISQRIEDEDERTRLKQVVEDSMQAGGYAGGYIVRTAAEGAGADEISADMEFLARLWMAVELQMKDAATPSIIHEDLPLFMRTMRDVVRHAVEKIRIDSLDSAQRVAEFATRFTPELLDKIEHYSGDRPLFDLFNVEDEIQKALSRKVQLKSGGYLILDQTEAMTTVDVNTGAFVGHRNLEETIFKTNMEAAQALARQVRLRNLGGIIIIDFIDMKDPEHKRQVLRALEKAMERDHAKVSITGVSELGLVEMTRKRTRESLGHTLCEPCPVCEGRASVKTAETVCYEIFREILREARAYENKELLVLASQSVVDRLLDEESSTVADLEELIHKTIRFQVEPMYTQEQFDVVLL